MRMTASYVRAMVQRAADQGHTEVLLNIKDMQELLPYIDSGVARERLEGRMRPAGWANPTELRTLNSERRKPIRLSGRKTAERCMQVYRCDEFHDMEAESQRLHARDAERRAQRQAAKEAANVPDPLP